MGDEKKKATDADINDILVMAEKEAAVQLGIQQGKTVSPSTLGGITRRDPYRNYDKKDDDKK